ncbi:hypothetical protein LPJ77_002340 [Coemansia sp. RSA 2523]|nr:hypothetical protein LPJ69_003269 [Coemansia sp. RSA 1752]KAJ1776309.1 hypothetical protein LPJ54_003157 [Coemansia sp. RSA 1824]KAJ1787478.1 hypothetical protein LPJ67_003191 [Coemansia sp. RSA 1938]KAJ1791508.1 hypothetical protein LPJ62_001361 [Coemansia sp. RSA 2167]KAJ1808445.1 hypothetical protein LPJ77_002340 [Coemansia sp. RSA 2523]KAJ2127225.1 hypothetical protein GGF48_003355 [Coemansia sp. RSA 921]KAJ2139422.1 hypothetical protein GGH17_000528 [Coemansia sp. RSA 788]KAJ2145203.
MSADSDIIIKAALGAGLVCAFFFCGAVFLIYFHVECWPRPRVQRLRVRPFYAGWTLGPAKRSVRVLTDEEIEEGFPAHGCNDTRVCPVCLDDMACGQMVRGFECKHCFHVQCIDPWLSTNASCPSCRKQIKLPHGAKAT